MPDPTAGGPAGEIRRAVRGALTAAGTAVPAGSTVLAAVSGGADSLALAMALAAEGPPLGLRAGAVTVDHGLQAGSEGRAETAAAACRGLGLDPVLVERVTVGTTGGPEAAARAARYGALQAAAERTGAVAILLGHTLDDQAETVLLGLARGSGARSLAGMRPVRGPFLRPLLGVRREATRAACAAAGLPVWDDPHNNDPSYTRVRVRRDALPALEAALGPKVAEALARSAALLAADADALDQWAADEAANPAALDLAVLRRQPPAVRTRVIRLAALAAGCPAGALTAAHVAAVDALVCDAGGRGAVRLPGRLEVTRACDRLRIR